MCIRRFIELGLKFHKRVMIQIMTAIQQWTLKRKGRDPPVLLEVKDGISERLLGCTGCQGKMFCIRIKFAHHIMIWDRRGSVTESLSLKRKSSAFSFECVSNSSV
jgi:hypothetical protein